MLYECQNNGNLAISRLPTVIAICHNDMDSKNVLWYGSNFKIIDLECLGYSNPYLELLELALAWSGYEQGNIDFGLFNLFIKEYFKDTPKLEIDWKAICDSNYNRIEWLEYNIKRALLIECGESEEQKTGVKQVCQTMGHVRYYNIVAKKPIA